MVDYPGEQVLDDAVLLPSTDFWNDAYYGLQPDEPGESLAVPDGTDALFYGTASDLLITDTISEVNWIVELDTGGTFDIATSWDADWSYDVGSMSWTSQTVTLSAGRHVFPVAAEFRDYSHVSNAGALVLRVQVASGSPVFGAVYLQIEGPAGYLVMTGDTTLGPWVDSPTYQHTPRLDTLQQTWHSSLNEPGSPTDDTTALVEAAFTAAIGMTTPVTYDFVDVSGGGVSSLASIYITTYSTDFGTINRSNCSISTSSSTLVWPSDGSVTKTFSMSGLPSLGVYGRDYVGFEWNPAQTTHAVEWLSGFSLIPVVAYSESPPGPVTSPQDDAYAHTLYGTLSGSQAPLNPPSIGDYLTDPSLATGVISVTPPPGDVVLSVVNPWMADRELVPPVGGWVPEVVPMSALSAFSASSTVHATQLGFGVYVRPKIGVFVPQARMIAPIFELSSDSIGTGLPTGPTWPADWYLPGWGSWDWFPDYGWEDYPADPVIDWPTDWYIPLPELPTYHYLPFDLNTNTQLGEIPLEDVSYSHKLSDAGTASFSFPVTPDMLKQQIKQSSIPGKTGLYIIRDNQIVWGGIIWKRMYDSSSRRVRIEAGSFESYFDHRFQSNVLGFEDVDQMTIARTLALQAADEMHIDVDPATSGVNRYYNAFYYDFKTIGGEIDSLASLWDGFDWNVRVYLDTSGVVRRRLVWGFPNLGVSAAATELLFEYPGNIRSYTVTEDADKAGNRLWAIGGGQGLDQIQYEAIDMAQLDAGWPLLETTTAYKDVFDPPRLQARSIQDLERLRPPVTILDVEVDPFSDPILGTYNPGDWARFIIEDHWNNPGIDIKRRIVGYNVTISANSPLDRVSLQIDAGDET